MDFECFFEVFLMCVNFNFIICDSYFCRIMSVDVGQTLKYVQRNATCIAFSQKSSGHIQNHRETNEPDTGKAREKQIAIQQAEFMRSNVRSEPILIGKRGYHMKKTVSIILTSLLALSLTACGAANQSSSAGNSEKYVIGTDATYPPFEFQQDGKYVGIDIDLIHAIAEEEGFEVEVKPMDFKGIIPSITSKQLDGAIAGISITDERKQIVDFSEPYYQAGLSLIVHEDNTDITKPEDLKGKVIAIKKGTSGAVKADELAKTYGATVKYFDDSPSMYQEVANKNADATIEDFPVISYKIAVDSNSKLKIVGDRLNGDFYGIAVGKGDEELLNKINSGLKKVQENGKYDEIVSKYLGTSAK